MQVRVEPHPPRVLIPDVPSSPRPTCPRSRVDIVTTPFRKLAPLAPGFPSCLSGQSFQPLSPVFPLLLLLLSFLINPDAPRELLKIYRPQAPPCEVVILSLSFLSAVSVTRCSVGAQPASLRILSSQSLGTSHMLATPKCTSAPDLPSAF